MEMPELLRCPISMETMEDPVTIATGVTYERKNIEKWLFTYKRSTCPATMQVLDNFDLTPNHTLKRLITSLPEMHAAQKYAANSPSTSSSSATEHCNLISLLNDISTSPFKLNSLKKLHSVVSGNVEAQRDLVSLGGIEVLGETMLQVLSESVDFNAFRACEEALSVFDLLPFTDESTTELVLNSECMKPMMVMLQRGSAEARIHMISILMKILKIRTDWLNSTLTVDSDIDVFKSLLELLSDDAATKLSSAALDALLEIVSISKKNRIKAIETGAICVLIELLPDANKHNCEKILLLLKRLCECPEGRAAFVEHELGIAAVSKRILRVSELGTKISVKILWLVCSSVNSEKVFDSMMMLGAVRKLLGLLHVGGLSSTKKRAMKIINLHSNAWRQYPCFPCEFKGFQRLMQDSQYCS